MRRRHIWKRDSVFIPGCGRVFCRGELFRLLHEFRIRSERFVIEGKSGLQLVPDRIQDLVVSASLEADAALMQDAFAGAPLGGSGQLGVVRRQHIVGGGRHKALERGTVMFDPQVGGKVRPFAQIQDRFHDRFVDHFGAGEQLYPVFLRR